LIDSKDDDEDEISQFSKLLDELRKLGKAEVRTPLGWVDIIIVLAMFVAFIRAPPEFYSSGQLVISAMFLGGIGYVSAREAEKNLDKRLTRQARMAGHR